MHRPVALATLLAGCGSVNPSSAPIVNAAEPCDVAVAQFRALDEFGGHCVAMVCWFDKDPHELQRVERVLGERCQVWVGTLKQCFVADRDATKRCVSALPERDRKPFDDFVIAAQPPT